MTAKWGESERGVKMCHAAITLKDGAVFEDVIVPAQTPELFYTHAKNSSLETIECETEEIEFTGEFRVDSDSGAVVRDARIKRTPLYIKVDEIDTVEWAA